MEPVYVISAGATEAALVGEFVRAKTAAGRVKVVRVAGHASAVGVARTRAALGPASAVALVLNADTTNELRARGDHADLQALLRMAAGGRPCETFLFMPEVEVVLFQSPDRLAAALGLKRLTEANLVAGRYAPKQEIAALVERAGRTYDAKEAARLARAVGAETMLRNATAAELNAFVSRHLARTPAVSVA